MDGNERERMCKQCSQKVFNISDMTKSEAETFLANNVERGDACIFYYKRADGTIKTENCPKYLRPVRDFGSWIYRGAMLVTALAVGVVLSQNEDNVLRPFSKFFSYKTKDFECTGWAGRPAPNEIRENTYNVLFEARDHAPKSLVEQFEKEERDQLINILTLNALGDFYRVNKMPLQLFHVRLLEELVRQKMPQPQKKFDVLEFEKIRQEALEQALDKIDQSVKAGADANAALLCNSFTDLASSGYSLVCNSVESPANVREWKTLDGNPFFMSPDVMERALVLFRKVDEKICGVNDLVIQLEGAKRLTLAEPDKFERIKKEILQQRRNQMQINGNITHPCVIARIVKTQLIENVVPKNAVADYEVIQNVDPSTPRDSFQFLFDQQALGFEKYLVPSVGSVHILFLQPQSGSYFTTESGPYGRLDYDPKTAEILIREKKKFADTRCLLREGMIHSYPDGSNTYNVTIRPNL
ncbi:MAG: hypothetical protein SFY67_01375 [Candidatus Melainabacteria bacterium]|nr:hypothetical protein [Candidatus Melainabacteria bacterium]